jgi:alkaline phosphatase
VLAATLVVVTIGPSSAGKPTKPPAPSGPRNVIIFIGDGMGPEQVRLGRVYKKALTGDPLHIDGIRWGAKGTLDTASLDGITDSAAGATALATGQATLNGWVGMIPTDPPTAVETALEQAEDIGKATGLVTSVGMTNATTASFSAHVTDRGEDDEIAAQMATQGIEVLMGAGQDDPLLNLPGVTYVNNVTDIQAYAAGTGAGPLYALMGVESLAHPIDKDDEGVVGIEPTLAEMTTASLDVLNADPQGFFLMVEDGAIDWAGHSRDGAWSATDMIQMDDAVKAAYDWAKNRTDTLILVTADHECGGLSFTTKGGDAVNTDLLLGQTASVEFMWGELKTLDWTRDSVVRDVVESYTNVPLTRGDIDEIQRIATLGSGEMGLADVLSDHYNVYWGWDDLDEGDHTDTPVPIYAWGPGASDFAGTAYPNERVGQLLLSYFGA